MRSPYVSYILPTRSRPNITTVAIQKDIYEKVKKVAELKGRTIQDYINETLLMNVERDEFLKIFAPYLSLEHASNNTIFLHDEKLNETILIKLKYYEDKSYDCNVDVFCEHDQSDECLHVRFALALPELMQLNLKRTKLKLDGKIKRQNE